MPPRAQSAYQQAMYLARALPRLTSGMDSKPFVYTDQGSLVSLVSLAEYSSAGAQLGRPGSGGFF